MRNKSWLGLDWWLIAPVFVLVTISMVTLLSLSQALFLNQLFTLFVGIIAFFLFSRLRVEILESLSLPMYIISVILLFIVLIIGYESKGSVRWVSFFGLPIQFSEVLKPFLAVSLCSYLSKRRDTTLRSLITVLALLAPVFVLIALQPDLGNALIYVGTVVMVLIVYGFPFKWFGLLLLPFFLVAPILWGFLHDYQQKRLLTFINPTSDPLGSSYNVIQAMIAVGSGMFLGKGLSQGTQSGLRFLPERHTDFIFATLSEGLGFIGSLIIIGAFAFLCFRIYTIFARMENSFAKLFTACVFSFLLIHVFVNIGMNIGIIPIVGVTLPFVSYGGNSLLSNFILLGIVTALVATYSRRSVLEIR